MNPESLGWSSFFSDQLKDGGAISNQKPSRVVGMSRTEVTLHDGHTQFKTRIGGKWFRNRGKGGGEQPIIGDWVLVDSENKMTRLLNRRNAIERVHPYKPGKVQLMTANLDKLLIVFSCNEDYNESRIERFLTLATSNNIEPVLVLTKADLTDQSDWYETRTRTLTSCKIYLINATNDGNCEKLREYLLFGETTALIGSSGVGKSTIVNSLFKQDVQKTQSVRMSDSKGRHTTTARSLHILPNGSLIIDSPGIREIALVDEHVNLESSFGDILELAKRCRFSNCRHGKEPGCAIQTAITNGELSPRRLESFLKLSDNNSID